MEQGLKPWSLLSAVGLALRWTTMVLKIEEVEGRGPVYAQKLNDAGVKTDADMLDRAGSAKARAELTVKTGISAALILKWANHVDLMRISGVGPQYAEMLEAGGRRHRQRACATQRRESHSEACGGKRSERAGRHITVGISSHRLD
jgi:predicted flap endonuclease-1-like 5' DNA nuclease